MLSINARFRSFVSALAAFAVIGAISVHAAEPRQHETFDFGWKFHLGDQPGAELPSFDDSAWRTLDLPHDWSIEGGYDEHAHTRGSGGYLPTGIGCYRKTFVLPSSAQGRRVLVQFDGVYQNSTVWINGHQLGTRPYGYSTFGYDLTPYVRFGTTPNVIAVRVDNSAQPNSRWYSGSGIYRHTWLTVTDPLAIAPTGIYVTTPEISSDRASVHVRTRLLRSGSDARSFDLVSRILDADGRSLAAENEVTVGPLSLDENAEREIDSILALHAPRLWSPATPNLYLLRSEIRVEGQVVDAVETVFGVRSLDYDVNRGLLLNGTPVKLRGMCLHHDGGAVGAAVPEAVLERRLRLLQEAGVNAIRCSHNPMAPEFYDLCDRLGLLVMDEAFDEWTVRKPQLKFGYSGVFNAWYERDLIDFIRRDRNHPCVVMWSAGNEIGEQRGPQGPDVLSKLVEVFHREDPTRPVTAAMDNIFTKDGQAPVAFSGQLDVVGYNYVDRWGPRRETHYADDRDLFPKRKFVGTEDTNPYEVRGDYRFGALLGGSFDFLAGQWIPGVGPEGALYLTSTIRTESLWRFVATHDYVIGNFGWTGIDYLGESRWPRKLASPGLLDTCGFKKDAFYFFQSQWTTAPMVHLLPHWNWPDRVGQVVPVVAYSNCAAVELFLNGRSLGLKAREFPAQGTSTGWNTYALPQIHATTADLHLAWDVIYEPGELKAVGYDRDAHVVAETVVRTAGPVVRLEVTVDRDRLTADARDVAHVTVRALDANGGFVPLADNEIVFVISGPAALIGVDNGDPASHESYKTNRRALFHGLALALVQSTKQPGEIRVAARATGLAPVTVTLNAAARP